MATIQTQPGQTQPGQTPPGGGPPPILLAFDGPAPQRRLTVAFRFVLILPQLVVVSALGAAAEVVAVAGWFGALFTGRLPAFAYEFLCPVLDWQVRVNAYLLLLTDRYPPFAMGPADYPVRLVVPPPQPLNRLSVLFRLVLAVPAAFVTGVVYFGASTAVLFVTWVVVLATGRMPDALYGAYAAALRAQTRYTGWLGMLTAAYPIRGILGDPPAGATGPGVGPAPTGPPAAGPVPPAGPVPGGPVPGGPPAVVPDVFTYGGPTYLWGYTADRGICGVWWRNQPAHPPEWWPVARHAEGWARFRELEAAAVEYQGPPPAALGFGPASAAAAPGPGSVAPVAPGPSTGVPAGVGPAGGTLVLSPAARAVVGVFGLVGLLGAGLYVGVAVSLAGRVPQVLPNFPALVTVQADYEALQGSTDTYQSATRGCADSGAALSCYTAANRAEGQAFAAFSRDLRHLTVSGRAANEDRTDLERLTDQAALIFSARAAATSPAAYDALGDDLSPVLRRFDVAYDRLQQALSQLFPAGS